MEKFRKVRYNPTQDVIAKVNRRTGVLTLNSTIWDDLPTDQKEFVLFHEEGHLRLQTANEYAANKYAIEKFTSLKSLHNRTLGQKIMVMREILGKADDNLESGFIAELAVGASTGIMQSLSVLGIGSKARQKEAAAQAAANVTILEAQSDIAKQKAKNTTKVLIIGGVMVLVIAVIILTLRKK